jgi:dipeptidyl aminopeptidase/acylaminoacyl peptidase
MSRPITPEDLWTLARVGALDAAPDGSFAVVTVTTFDVEENEGRGRLYRVDRDGAVTPLTSPDADATAPSISPDGTRVAFLRKTGDDSKPQVHIMRLDGGEAQRITDLPLGAARSRWSRDGRYLVFPAPLLAGHPDAAATAAEVKARKERKVTAVATEDRMYRYWDKWVAGGEIHHLFRVDADGGDPVDLTPGWDRPIHVEDPGRSFDIGPEGEIAFSSLACGPPYEEAGYAVYVLAPGGEPEPMWADGPPLQVRPRYSPDGTSIAFGFAVDYPEFYADRIRLAIRQRDRGQTRILTGDWDRSCGDWVWAADGSSLVFSAEEDARQHLYIIAAVGGDPTRVASGGWLDTPRPAGVDTYWCLHQSITQPPDVALVAGGEVTRIGRFNEAAMEAVDTGQVREARFSGARGDEIQMFVVEPPGFDASRQWPLVHSIHGGPHGTWGDSWHWRWNPLVFAAPGYVVALVNFHGSTSWGTEFATSIQGAWGEMPTIDIEAATDHLIGAGSVDPDRMAITGGSYGGYMVAWLIGQTDRYRTAICHAGVTNLVGQWATDTTYGRHAAFGGVPWDGLDRIQQWSPTDHTAAMNTPTLVIHGERDYRVVVTQGLELYGILKAKGVEARLLYYPDEGHWILKPQNSLLWYREFLGWLQRFLAN